MTQHEYIKAQSTSQLGVSKEDASLFKIDGEWVLVVGDKGYIVSENGEIDHEVQISQGHLSELGGNKNV